MINTITITIEKNTSPRRNERTPPSPSPLSDLISIAFHKREQHDNKRKRKRKRKRGKIELVAIAKEFYKIFVERRIDGTLKLELCEEGLGIERIGCGLSKRILNGIKRVKSPLFKDTLCMFEFHLADFLLGLKRFDLLEERVDGGLGISKRSFPWCLRDGELGVP